MSASSSRTVTGTGSTTGARRKGTSSGHSSERWTDTPARFTGPSSGTRTPPATSCAELSGRCPQLQHPRQTGERRRTAAVRLLRMTNPGNRKGGTQSGPTTITTGDVVMHGIGLNRRTPPEESSAPPRPPSGAAGRTSEIPGLPDFRWPDETWAALGAGGTSAPGDGSSGRRQRPGARSSGTSSRPAGTEPYREINAGLRLARSARGARRGARDVLPLPEEVASRGWPACAGTRSGIHERPSTRADVGFSPALCRRRNALGRVDPRAQRAGRQRHPDRHHPHSHRRAQRCGPPGRAGVGRVRGSRGQRARHHPSGPARGDRSAPAMPSTWARRARSSACRRRRWRPAACRCSRSSWWCRRWCSSCSPRGCRSSAG